MRSRIACARRDESFVGERRLDLVQFRTVCAALGTTLPEFVARWEERLAQRRKGKK